MLSFLSPYALLLKVGGAILLLGASFGAGFWLEDKLKTSTILQMQRDQAQAIVISQALAARKQAAADKITHDADVADVAAHQKIVTVAQTIIRKVPTYVTQQTDTRFPLPCGFVRLLDAAASSADPASVPLPANHTDADKCPVAASDAASIIAANYALALGWRQDVKTWEDWYKVQSENWNK